MYNSKINYTNNDMSLLKMPELNQYFHIKTSEEKECVKDSSKITNLHDPSNEIKELLELIREYLLSNESNQLCIFDVSSKYAVHPGFHFAATRLTMDNLIYLRCHNFTYQKDIFKMDDGFLQ